MELALLISQFYLFTWVDNFIKIIPLSKRAGFLFLTTMILEELHECPVCKNSTFTPYIGCKDYLVSQIDFNIQACTSCGLRFTNPRPNKESIGEFYQSADYVSHNDQSAGIVNKLYRLVRQYTLRQKLNLIDSIYPKKGKVLDIGCGTGLFLDTCQKNGWSIAGVEPDTNAREIAVTRLKENIVNDLSEIHDEQFDLITMWHVLEHVADLRETVQELNRRLRKGGTLLLALPNSDSHDAQYFKQYWAAYDTPRHLSHFTPSTINQLVSQTGFSLVDTKPMYFDSFYIGVLSTRNRDGRTNWLESIYQGIRSNWAGKRTGDYSSLIYIFMKS